MNKATKNPLPISATATKATLPSVVSPLSPSPVVLGTGDTATNSTNVAVVAVVATGMVVSFRAGWGFIRPDAGGDDVFAHCGQIVSRPGMARELMVGQRVSYTVGCDPRGRVGARKIRVLG